MIHTLKVLPDIHDWLITAYAADATMSELANAPHILQSYLECPG